jgi:hypothetical protein
VQPRILHLRHLQFVFQAVPVAQGGFARLARLANVATGEEVWRRQLSQWQWVVSTASPANSNWIAPHRQRPVVVICLLPS